MDDHECIVADHPLFVCDSAGTICCMSTYLVIGGTGKTGRRVVDRLAGHDVRVASRATGFDWADPHVDLERRRRRLPHRPRPGPAQPGARSAPARRLHRPHRAALRARGRVPPATARSRRSRRAVAGHDPAPHVVRAELHGGLPAAGRRRHRHRAHRRRPGAVRRPRRRRRRRRRRAHASPATPGAPTSSPARRRSRSQRRPSASAARFVAADPHAYARAPRPAAPSTSRGGWRCSTPSARAATRGSAEASRTSLGRPAQGVQRRRLEEAGRLGRRDAEAEALLEVEVDEVGVVVVVADREVLAGLEQEVAAAQATRRPRRARPAPTRSGRRRGSS